jgi:tRNA(fMet)-specific endonuclease VapC
MLTDSTFWIDLWDERRSYHTGPAHNFIARHRSQSLEVSIITWGELAVGFQNSNTLEGFLKRVRVLSLSRQVAWEASRIQRELQNVGGQLGENDNWIAATARVYGLRLITRDAAFQRVPRLTVATY